MNKYNNPRLLNAVVSGTGMKHPIQPHVVVGDVSNGFIRGDLMDANAIVDLVNSGDVIDQETIRQAVADVIGTAPENLDTLGEIVETLDAAVLDPNTEGSLANQISVINTTIEDNELTIAAALNDLNSRINDIDLQSVIDQLDGEDGLVNLVSSINTKLNKVYDTLMPLEFGDYLLSDLKTKVRQANITEAQKADVVGICIGLNPYTKKDIFVNVDGLTNSTGVKFNTSNSLPNGVFTMYGSSEQTGTIGTNKINDEVLLNDTTKIAGKITSSHDVSATSSDHIYQINDFAGLHNTIEWAKQAKAGNGTIDQYPALQRTLGYSGITSFDDVDDNYDGWFLASTGYGVMMCPSISQSDEVSSANYNSLKTAVLNLGKTLSGNLFWGSSLYNLYLDNSQVYCLYFSSNSQEWTKRYVGYSNRLFALIER